MSILEPDLGYLRGAIESLLQQSYRTFEVIVLEDPSPTSAESLVAEFDDPRIIYRRNPENVSLAESRNRCIELARGQLLAVMDADDICHPERLAKQYAFMQAEGDVAVLGSQISLIDAAGESRGFRKYPLQDQAIRQAMRRFNPLAHPSIMMRKSAILAAGGYDPASGGVCDDYDLWSRLASSSARFANLSEVLLQYRLHGGSTKSRKLRQTLADSIRIKKKYFGPRFTARERLRILGEQALLRMPAPMVLRLFRMTNLSSRPTSKSRQEGRLS